MRATFLPLTSHFYNITNIFRNVLSHNISLNDTNFISRWIGLNLLNINLTGTCSSLEFLKISSSTRRYHLVNKSYQKISSGSIKSYHNISLSSVLYMREQHWGDSRAITNLVRLKSSSPFIYPQKWIQILYIFFFYVDHVMW
jgi:hypothetical protein